MTELQPTAIELRGSKNRNRRLPRKRIIAAAVIILMIAGAAGLTAMIAYRASIDPVIIQPATLPPETDDILVDD